MNIFNYINIIVLLAAAAIGIRAGGRYERYVTALLLADTAVSFGLQHLTGDYGSPWLAVEHGFLFAVLAWLARRERSLWLVGVVVAQLGVLAADVVRLSSDQLSLMRYLTLANLLANSQLVLLVFGVVRRRFGPPYAVPARGPEPSLRRGERAFRRHSAGT